MARNLESTRHVSTPSCFETWTRQRQDVPHLALFRRQDHFQKVVAMYTQIQLKRFRYPESQRSALVKQNAIDAMRCVCVIRNVAVVSDKRAKKQRKQSETRRDDSARAKTRWGTTSVEYVSQMRRQSVDRSVGHFFFAQEFGRVEAQGEDPGYHKVAW